MTEQAEAPPERIIIPMDSRLVEQIDDFRYARRIPSRAKAIRRLIKAGLEKEVNAKHAEENHRPNATPAPIRAR